jgi:hypothetical protein
VDTAIQNTTTGKFKFKRVSGGTLLIACGALAKEVVQIIEINKLKNIDVQCLPAQLHHRPGLIPAALEKLLKKHHTNYKKIYVVYGDCGTDGGIDKILQKYQVERIGGAHCFSFFEGNDNFANYEEDTTTFFLTDFLCKHFEKFIWQEFGLDREESKTGLIFGNYKKVVYLAQTENADLKSKALEIADRLGLDFEYRYRGYSDLGVFIENIQ